MKMMNLAVAALAARVLASPRVVRGSFRDVGGADLLENIEGLDAASYTAYVQAVNPYYMNGDDGLLGDVLFPARQQETLEVKYLKGVARVAVMAGITHHNAEAPIVPREGVGKVQTEVPAIKQKRPQDAETILALASGEASRVQQALNDIYDDVRATRIGVRARVEWIRMRAFALGRVQYNQDGLNIDVDFQVPAGHKAENTGTARWDDDDSDPIGDMKAWRDQIRDDRGVIPTRGATRQAIIDRLLVHPKVRRAVWGQSFDAKLMTEQDLATFLQGQKLPILFAYEKMAQLLNDAGNRVMEPFFPDDRLVLFPGGMPLGYTPEAPTAHEALVKKGLASGRAAMGSNRIITRTYATTQDPPAIMTLSEAASFVAFQEADHVFQAKVN